MTIQITKRDDTITITQIAMLIYGQPGAYKSSLAQTANAPLTLDFDGGIHRAYARKDAVRVRSWEDVAGLSADDLAPYQTVVVDTVGRLLDLMAISLIQGNPKLGRSTGALTLQGYGELKANYAAWLKTLLGYGKDVVLIAHDKEDKDGDNMIIRPDIQGGSYGEVFKRADAIGYLYRGLKGTILDFNPSDRWIGKNAGGVEPAVLPHFSAAPTYCADVIAHIKATLNHQSEASRAVANEVEQWRTDIDQATTPDAIMVMVARSKSLNGGALGAQVRALIAQRAKTLNLTWQGGKEKGKYVAAPSIS